MESVDYWDNSQFDSVGIFDDSINMVVNDSIASEEAVEDAAVRFSDEDMDMMVLDTYDDEKTIPSTDEALPCLGRRMMVTLKKDAHVVVSGTNASDLIEPCGEEEPMAIATFGGRDFDLNKFPIKGMFELDDLKREESFIEMLRLLLPYLY